MDLFYIGPGMGIGSVILFLLIGGIVLFAFGFIFWIKLKNIFKKKNSIKKVSLFVSIFILSLFLFSLFGWSVKEIYSSEGKWVKYAKIIKPFVEFPDSFTQAVDEVQKLPETFVETPMDFQSINKLSEDLNVLIAYTNQDKERAIDLVNLKEDKIIHSWKIKNPYQTHDRIYDPIFFKDTSLCYSFNGVSGITKIDKNGDTLWDQNQIIHHHSMNLDSAGNIWACSYIREPKGHIFFKGEYVLGSKEFKFVDNAIVQLNKVTGEIVFEKYMAEIIKENALNYLILKSPNIDDPFHINDIQPALHTTAYYNEGDLFISSRNLSCIFHYRPSINKVLEVISGPFTCQHDVDITSDSTLLFFNNNTHVLEPANYWGNPMSKTLNSLGEFNSNLIRYQLKDNSFEILLEKEFNEHSIFTSTEGTVEQIDDSTFFVEEQNSSVIWVIQNSDILYKNVLVSPHAGHHHLTNWPKVIK